MHPRGRREYAVEYTQSRDSSIVSSSRSSLGISKAGGEINRDLSPSIFYCINNHQLNHLNIQSVSTYYPSIPQSKQAFTTSHYAIHHHLRNHHPLHHRRHGHAQPKRRPPSLPTDALLRELCSKTPLSRRGCVNSQRLCKQLQMPEWRYVALRISDQWL